MKKLLALLLAAIMVFSLAACGGGDSGSGSSTSTEAADESATDTTTDTAVSDGDTYELALITDIGTIDDKSFNQGSWEGLKKYAEEHSISHKYYQPTEKSTDAYLSAIELAIKGGAKVVVTPGYLFEESIYMAQESHPDVFFILIDGSPNNGEDYLTAENTVGVAYAEEEAGFLAGYAAVKDGMTQLGFMGGMAVPAVVRFGPGFVQGAEYAAAELGLDSVSINYHYTGGFDATPEAQTLAASWYQSGVEVIFGCGGAVGNSVMAAAEATDNGKVIGVDVDQSNESPTVITSSMKGLGASVYNLIEQYYAGTFPGGQNLVFDATNDGVMLPMETSKFDTFTQADYDAIYAQLVSGSIDINSDLEISADQLGTTIVSVQLVA